MYRIPYILAGLVFVGFFVMIGFGVHAYHVQRRKCTDNGGRWVNVNCRMHSSFECSYDTDWDTGARTLRECHTEEREVCDEKCVGASAEAQQ